MTTGTNLGPFLAAVPEGQQTTGTISRLEFVGDAVSSSLGSRTDTIAGTGTGTGTFSTAVASTSSTSGPATSSASGSGSGLRVKTPRKDDEADSRFLDDSHSHHGLVDEDDEWEMRLPRRALWYNPEWVSGYQRAASSEMVPLASRREDTSRRELFIVPFPLVRC